MDIKCRTIRAGPLQFISVSFTPGPVPGHLYFEGNTEKCTDQDYCTQNRNIFQSWDGGYGVDDISADHKLQAQKNRFSKLLPVIVIDY